MATKCQRFYQRHKIERREKTRKYNFKLRIEVFSLLGNKCRLCGFNDWRALKIDHTNGNGVKDKKSTKGNYIKSVLEQIKNGSDKYQLLCANCNWIKRYTNNETTIIKK